MTPCARGCCWVPMDGVCARAYLCRCHWSDRKPAGQTGTAGTHADPTANEAIRRAMKGTK